MSELRVDTIKPSFNTKVVITPGFVVRDTQDTDQFEVTASGETKVFGPLNVGSIVSHTPGTAGQLLSSQGAGLPPVWVPAIPFGGIIMWYGSVSSIPAGWVLCDGVTRTILGQSWTPPDLRDRFVVGAGTTYSVNQTGGANTITLTSAQIPSSISNHRHKYGAFCSLVASGPFGSSKNPTSYMTNSVSTGGGTIIETTFGGELQESGAGPNETQNSGSMVATTGTIVDINGNPLTAGGDQSHENRPPFYALCYIMRVPTQ